MHGQRDKSNGMGGEVITDADTTLICKLAAERQRLLAEAQELEKRADALTDFQIGQKFGISALQVRDIVKAHKRRAA